MKNVSSNTDEFVICDNPLASYDCYLESNGIASVKGRKLDRTALTAIAAPSGTRHRLTKRQMIDRVMAAGVSETQSRIFIHSLCNQGAFINATANHRNYASK